MILFFRPLIYKYICREHTLYVHSLPFVDLSSCLYVFISTGGKYPRTHKVAFENYLQSLIFLSSCIRNPLIFPCPLSYIIANRNSKVDFDGCVYVQP